ncbi:MAG TPA: lysophospholipid acyltransferase family protein [Pseudolabrys sp.]|nr:lysophospholipid acyltransferase family protein [Pseudolabrys sp.]
MRGGRAGKLVLDVYDTLICAVGAAVFVGSFVASSLLALPLRLLLPRRVAQELGRAIIMYGFRACLRYVTLTGRARLDLTELDALREERGLIIAANHPALWDIALIVSRMPNLACIMKVDVANNVLLFGAAALAGYISNASIHQMMRQAIAQLKEGDQLLIFPEGTRTVRQPINALTSSIGVIASHAKAPIQTVFIETSSTFLTKGRSLLKIPDLPLSVRVRLGRRFPPPTDARDFVDELERYFIAELGASHGANRTASATNR